MDLIHVFDVLIMISYFAIPIELAVFVYRLPLKDWKSQVVCLGFCAFIFLCGVTHLLHLYQITTGSVVVYGITAFVSITTACLLVLVIPHILSLPVKLEAVRRQGEQQERFRQFVMLLSAHTSEQRDPFLLLVAATLLKQTFPAKEINVIPQNEPIGNRNLLCRDDSALLVVDAKLNVEHDWLFRQIATHVALLTQPAQELRGVDRKGIV